MVFKGLRMKLHQFSEWVKKQKWVWAKTYAKFAPHYYVVKNKENLLEQAAFLDASKFIKNKGYKGKFYNREYKYYKFSGWKYWTTGPPSGEITVINREKIKLPRSTRVWEFG